MPGPTKVISGAKFKDTPLMNANFINDAVDCVNAFKGGELGGRSSGTPSTDNTTDTVRVKNITGADRLPGQVVQLGASLLSALDPRKLWFEGKTVAAPAARKYAILRVPLPANEIGLAQVSGVCVASVNLSDQSHGFCAPAEGSYSLASAASGPIEILSPATGGGVQDMCVRLYGGSGGSTSGQRIVKTTVTMVPNTIATVDIWDMGGPVPTISSPKVSVQALNLTDVTIVSDVFCLMTPITIGGQTVNFLEPWQCSAH